MNAKSLETKILAPGYGIIVAGSVFENLVLHTNWFKLGGSSGRSGCAPGWSALCSPGGN